ncbi:MAG: hypothetical protein E4G98_04885 [Promethearchaeota archaeon]|nr:MAG: hypothetical protein E4G98_04885 [Candidatus Lokiarchaeota archaeon]
MLRKKTVLKIFIFGGLLFLFLAPLTQAGIGANDGNSMALENSGMPKSATTVDTSISIKNFTRVTTIDETGILSYDDSYIFANKGPNTQVSLLFGLMATEANNLIYFQAYDQNMGTLTGQLSELKLSETNIFQVLLSEPLLPYSEVTINIKFALRGFIQYQSVFGRFVITVQETPKSPYPIDYYTSEIHVPDTVTDVTLTDISNYVGPLENELEFVHRFFPGSTIAFQEFHNVMTFYDNQVKILQINRLDRTITVNPWGYISVKEDTYIQAYSSGFITELTLSLPQDYTNLKFSDNLGEILGVTKASEVNDDGTVDVTLGFMMNRAPLQYGQVMYYRMHYELPMDQYFSHNFGKRNFAIDMLPTKSNYLIIELNSRIELLKARKIDRINLDFEQIVETADGMVIETQDKYITNFHSANIDVTYRTNGFLMVDRAILLSFIFIALGALYVTVSNRKEKSDDIVISAMAIPITELQQFVTLYEERNAIVIELDALEENYLRRKVQKKAYVREEKTLSNKMKELEGEILPFKKSLLESSTTVAAVIQKLDYLEAEKMSLKDSIRNLNDRYRKGKLPSKAAYEKLSQDFVKKSGNSQRKIDRNINELRAYLI